MASGSALLTENGADGLDHLFTPGRHLTLFGPDDLLDQTAFLLENNAVREKMAAAGQSEVLAHHDITNRARDLVELIERAGRQADGAPFVKRLAEAKALFLTGLRWPDHSGLDRIERAEALLDDATNANQADGEALFQLGLIRRMKNEWQTAHGHLAAAAETGFIPGLIGLAWLHLEQGRLPQGRDILGRAATIANVDTPGGFAQGGRITADDHVALARILEFNGHELCPGFSRIRLHPALWTALEHYQAAVRTNPAHVPALEGLGDLLIRHNAHNEAAGVFEQASEIAPHNEKLRAKAENAAHCGYLKLTREREAA